MEAILNIPVFPVVLTLLAYQMGVQCQKKLKSPVFNPILIAVILVILTLTATGMTPARYKEGTQLMAWLMTPATVCLAIPMYEQIQVLRSNLKAIFCGVAAGTLSCMAMVLIFSLVMGFDRSLTVSLLPKGITAAIGVALTELFGGTPSITTISISVTGLFGNIFGVHLCRLFGITNDVARGVAFGTGAHVIGTAKASELSPMMGAVGSLSLVIAGLLMAAIFPLLGF